jgi:hypothetical protein
MSHIDDGKLNALLDGELEGAEAAAAQAHIAGCADCAQRLEEAKRFLAGAEDLLGALGMPRESATPQAQPRRVSKTAKEVALDLDGATQQSPALDADGGPLFHRGARAPRARPERRGFDYTSLAWAAIIVLAIGVGYLANEVRHARDEAVPGEGGAALQRAAPTTALASQPATDKAAPVSRAAPSAPGAAGAGRVALADRPGGPPAAKAPPGQAKPVVPGRSSTGLGHKRRDAPARTMAGARVPPAQVTRAADALASLGAEAPTVAAARAAPAPPAAAQAPALRNAAAPTPRPQPAAEAEGAGAPQGAGGAAQRAAVVGGLAARRETVRVSTLEEAVNRLQGTIRLIDGMRSDRVEIVPGHQVPEADTANDVVRVVYGEPGRELTLDQQRISAPDHPVADEGRRAQPSAGMGLSEVIVATSSEGVHRLSWSDNAGFWLSLVGPVPTDSLRRLAERVR